MGEEKGDCIVFNRNGQSVDELGILWDSFQHVVVMLSNSRCWNLESSVLRICTPAEERN